MNLSHKPLSELLQLINKDHSLDLFSDIKGLWDYILEFKLKI